MSLEEKDQNAMQPDKDQTVDQDQNENNVPEGKEPVKEETVLDEKAAAEAELAEMKDKYLRLYSEFDNFRRRTAKEKSDLIKSAGEDVIVSMLPVLDDFERAIKSFGENNDPVKEGVVLIYNKLKKNLEAKGLKAMESIGTEFNAELHEAITQTPAPSEDLKGKVVDEMERGYYLGDKVIRFAKVIIGS